MTQPNDGGPLVITLRDVYAASNANATQLAALAAKFDTFLATNSASQAAQDQGINEAFRRINAHEERFQRVEERLVKVENRPVITPKNIVTAVVIICTVVSTIAGLIAALATR